MKICWICKTPIEPGEASRDHVIPKSKSRFPERGVTWWADKQCNSARGSIAVEEVRVIQARGLSQFGLRQAMIDHRRSQWYLSVNREACEQ